LPFKRNLQRYAVGQVVFDTPTAEELHAQGKKCILVRVETSPEVRGLYKLNAVESNSA
jgi:hypothetical protein